VAVDRVEPFLRVWPEGTAMATTAEGCNCEESPTMGFDNQPLHIVGESPADRINRFTDSTSGVYHGPLRLKTDDATTPGRLLRVKNPIEDPRFWKRQSRSEKFKLADGILSETGQWYNAWCRGVDSSWVDEFAVSDAAE
jgi:hypothetical protein